MFNYLTQHACVDCGEKDVRTLEFDHNNPDEKTKNIAKMLSFSWKAIQLEIAKCVVRCANCHKKRTAKQFHWYKHLFLEDSFNG